MTRAADSTDVDPDGHVVAFENEHVRVLEIKLPPGRNIALHAHPPRMIVAVNGYRLRSTDRDGVVSIVDRRPGETVWTDWEEHTVEVLDGPTHTIEVEIKSLR